MQSASPPANEQERLAALSGLQILDTPPEAALNDITTIASEIITSCKATKQYFVNGSRQRLLYARF